MRCSIYSGFCFVSLHQQGRRDAFLGLCVLFVNMKARSLTHSLLFLPGSPVPPSDVSLDFVKANLRLCYWWVWHSLFTSHVIWSADSTDAGDCILWFPWQSTLKACYSTFSISRNSLFSWVLMIWHMTHTYQASVCPLSYIPALSLL